MLKKRHSHKQNFSKGGEIEDYVFSVTESEMSSFERPLERKRLQIFWWIIVAIIMIIGSRVFYLNVLRGAHYQEIATGNKIRSISIKAPRGKIYDRYGTVLVNNVPSLDLVILPADLPKNNEQIKSIVDKLSEIVNINTEELFSKMEVVDRYSFNPILIKENITRDELLLIAENKQNLPGVVVEKTAIRDYIDGMIFSHIIGYEGKVEKKELENNSDYTLTDYIGKQGIEKQYEKHLKGKNGSFQVEVDSMGNIKRERGVIQPQLGSDLILSVDAGLQKKIFDSLTAILEKTETKTAAAVAINPKNGEILALVSLPGYDNNLFAGKISQQEYASLINDPGKPLFNRAIAGEYPPGSVLKPLVALAALSEGTITQSTSVTCGGALHIGSFRFGDWKTHGSSIDVKKAIAESCDIFFYSIGGGYGSIKGLGMNKMKQYEDSFGLGQETGIDIPGERKGFIPDERWKIDTLGEKWFIGNSYHASIGQGFITATPLQLANYISAIANGGTLYQPKIVSQIKSGENQILNNKTQIKSDMLAPEWVIETLRDAMRMTVTDGTAQPLATVTVPVAGKTGTAQFGSENKTHAWFASFAPFNDPEIAMVVLVEGGGEGHSSAVPVTKEVYEWYFSNNH